MANNSWLASLTGNDTKLDDLENLVVMQLQDLYSAELQLIDALPKMADAASSASLQEAFHNHLEQTRGQKNRLEEAFRLLNREPQSEECEAMQGLIQEGETVIGLDGDSGVKDTALIAAAQRVEHYEMAGYGSARAFAQHLGRDDVAALLQQTLDEEAHADELLTEIAQTFVNEVAARS